MDRVMLSKSLIQFSANSWGCAHSLRQPSPGVCSLCARAIGSKDRANGGLLQVDISHTPHLPGLLLPEPLSRREATAELCVCRRPSNTHGQGWLSLLWGHCSFPWVLAWTSFVCTLQDSPIEPLLPSRCGFSFVLGHGVSFLCWVPTASCR